MAKTKTGKIAPTVETLKPYVDRALNDREFREDLKEALGAARKLYGPLVKDNRGITQSAAKLATDAKLQENLRRALEDFGKAAGTLKGRKKKGHKSRNTMLLAGLVAGALYNPWTGANTRQWLLDKVAGDGDLQPLDGFDSFDSFDVHADGVADDGSGVVDDVAEASAEDVADADGA